VVFCVCRTLVLNCFAVSVASSGTPGLIIQNYSINKPCESLNVRSCINEELIISLSLAIVGKYFRD